jgi:hypothetical protein
MVHDAACIVIHQPCAHDRCTVTIATKLDVHGFAMVQIFVIGNLKLKVV